MIQAILDFLHAQGSLPAGCAATLVRTGQSGTSVYRITRGGDTFFLKQAPAVRQEDLRELRFYASAGKLALPYVPRLLYGSQHPQWGLLLLLAAYRPLTHAQHDGGLAFRLAEVCARLHYADGPDIIRALRLRHRPLGTKEGLDRGFAGWCSLAARQEALSLTLLTEVYQRLPALLSALNAPPFQFLHGDLHPDNVLLDEADGVVLCDWQSYSLGKGVGDLSFYAQRGADFGISLDFPGLLDCYRDWAAYYAHKKLPMETLLRETYASTLYSVFLLWPVHLQDAQPERVLFFYRMLEENYRALEALPSRAGP